MILRRLGIFVLPLLIFARSVAAVPASNSTAPIYILVYDGFTALDALGPHQFLSFLAPERKIIFVAPGPQRQVKSDANVTLVADAIIGDEQTKEAGMILVPGGTMGTIAAARDPKVLQFVKRMSESGQLVVSVCTGALILGEAGLLKGKNATTHWILRSRLERYGAKIPSGKKASERFVIDGNLMTSAGVSAGLDLGLKIVGYLKGDARAKIAQLDAEYAPQPPYDSGTPDKASPETLRAFDGFYAPFLKEVDKLSKR